MLGAACGCSDATVARLRGVTADTVRAWRGRYADECPAGLAGRRRPGRPARFAPVLLAEVKALACQLPAETGVPLSRWSCPDLAAEAAGRGIIEAIPACAIRRILAADAIRPWQYRSWLFTRAPGFAARTARVLNLYARTWDGEPPGDDEHVISSGEKTSIQARCRCPPHCRPVSPAPCASTMSTDGAYEHQDVAACGLVIQLFRPIESIGRQRQLNATRPSGGIKAVPCCL